MPYLRGALFVSCLVVVGCAVPAPPPMFDSHVPHDAAASNGGDAGPDAGAHDAGVDAFVGVDAAVEDAGIDAFVAADSGLDAFVAIDAGSDASVAIDGGTDAFVAIDAGHDAFAAPDAWADDAYVAPDAWADDAWSAPDAWVPECSVGTDCTGTDDECSMRTCTMGVCGRAYTTAGTPISMQTAGDCASVVCDGSGGTTSVAAADPMDDGNPCTDDVCSGGVTTHPLASVGTLCPSGRCDDTGACVAIPAGIVVVRVGDGTTALSSAAAPVFLEHRSFTGVLGTVVPMPTAASATSRPLTLAGSSPSEGALTRSADGHYLVLAGYAAAPGTATVATSSSATVNRVAGRIDASDVVDTSTHFTSFTGASVRSATSVDGAAFWIAGASSGIQYALLGAATSAQIEAVPANNRVVSIFGAQLYGTSGSVGSNAVFTVGSGVPTTGGQIATPFVGMPVTSGPSPNAFQLFDASSSVAGLDLLYVADDRGAASGGGVQRWTFDGATWTLAATFNLGNGAIGVTGYRISTITYLYATTTNNRIVEIVDDGVSTPTPSTIATAVTNTGFRGIALPAL